MLWSSSRVLFRIDGGALHRLGQHIPPPGVVQRGKVLARRQLCNVLQIRRKLEQLAIRRGPPVLAPIAVALADGEEVIVNDLAAVRGNPADLGGYFRADPDKVAAVMRPSATLNAIIG